MNAAVRFVPAVDAAFEIGDGLFTVRTTGLMAEKLMRLLDHAEKTAGSQTCASKLATLPGLVIRI